MDNDFRLQTERLRLRAWQPGDAERLAEACNTTAVMRWLGGVQSQRQVKADIRYFATSESRHGFTYWAIERRIDDTFLGFCGLVRIPDRDCPIEGELEIGWRIRESDWRAGYGFEAAHAVLSFAFDTMRMAVVYSRTAGGNTASRKLMAKLGLKRCSEFDYVPVDEKAKLLVYSIAKEDWEKLQKARPVAIPPLEAPTIGSGFVESDTLTDDVGSYVTSFEWWTKHRSEKFEELIENEERFIKKKSWRRQKPRD